MAKKVKQVKPEVKQVKQEETEHQVKQAQKAERVMALEFLRRHGLDWVLERSLEEGDLDMLKASVQASVQASEDGTEEDYTEWASWWMPYTRVDGTPVKGVSWGISAPTTGGFVILRLVENRVVKATLKVWPGGRGLLMGAEPVVKALMGRPDIRPWTDEDLAGLLL